jgi:hypothetical protein
MRTIRPGFVGAQVRRARPGNDTGSAVQSQDKRAIAKGRLGHLPQLSLISVSIAPTPTNPSMTLILWGD